MCWHTHVSEYGIKRIIRSRASPASQCGVVRTPKASRANIYHFKMAAVYAERANSVDPLHGSCLFKYQRNPRETRVVHVRAFANAFIYSSRVSAWASTSRYRQVPLYVHTSSKFTHPPTYVCMYKLCIYTYSVRRTVVGPKRRCLYIYIYIYINTRESDLRGTLF